MLCSAPHRHRAPTIARGVSVLSSVAWLAAATLALSPTPVTAAPDPVTITVDSRHPGGRLPADFVGLSFEMRELGIGNLDPAQGNTAALLRTLGPGNLRIAGNTLDRDTLWVP